MPFIYISKESHIIMYNFIGAMKLNPIQFLKKGEQKLFDVSFSGSTVHLLVSTC